MLLCPLSFPESLKKSTSMHGHVGKNTESQLREHMQHTRLPLFYVYSQLNIKNSEGLIAVKPS